MSIAVDTKPFLGYTEYSDLTRQEEYDEADEEFNYNIFLTPVDQFYNGENPNTYNSPCKSALNFIDSILYSDAVEKSLKEVYTCNDSNGKSTSTAKLFSTNNFTKMIDNTCRFILDSAVEMPSLNEVLSRVQMDIKPVKLSSLINLDRIQLTRYEVEKSVLIESNNEDQEFSVKYTIDIVDSVNNNLSKPILDKGKTPEERRNLISNTLNTSNVIANANVNEKKSKIFELLNEKPRAVEPKTSVSAGTQSKSSDNQPAKKKRKNKNKKPKKDVNKPSDLPSK